MIVKKKKPVYKNQGQEPIHQKGDGSKPLKAICRAKSNQDLTHPNLDISVCEYLLPLVHWFLKIKISLVSHGSHLTFSSKSLFSIAPSHPSSILDNIRLGRTNLRLRRLSGTTPCLLIQYDELASRCDLEESGPTCSSCCNWICISCVI